VNGMNRKSRLLKNFTLNIQLEATYEFLSNYFFIKEGVVVMIDNKNLNQTLMAKEYLVKSCIKRLNIYKDFEDFHQVGMIALYQAIINYDEALDANKNFDVYAYYMILNSMRNEIKKTNRYFNNEEQYLTNFYGPTHYEFHNDLINMMELDSLISYLTPEERNIVEMRESGLKNTEIAQLLNITDEQLKFKIKMIFKKMRNHKQDLIN
jgi:RNA polymerase sigma factor (sigma-70 family)